MSTSLGSTTNVKDEAIKLLPQLKEELKEASDGGKIFLHL